MQQQIQQLTQSLNSLLALFKTHVHNGTDSQTLPTTSSGPSIYKIQINADGSTNILPTGWTVVKNSTGSYTVTHNLGVTTYTVALNENDGTIRFLIVNSPTSTNFGVLTYNPSFSNADSSFYVTVFN